MTNDTHTPADQPTAAALPSTVALGGVGSVPSLPLGEDGHSVVPMLRRDGAWQPVTAFAEARHETIARVLAHIEEGATLTAACDVAGIPVRTWSRWCAQDDSLAQDYAFSLKIGANSLYWSILDIARQSHNATTPEQARAYRNEMEAAKETAARMDAGQFGEGSSGKGAQRQAPNMVQQVVVRYDKPREPRRIDSASHAIGDGAYVSDDGA